MIGILLSRASAIAEASITFRSSARTVHEGEAVEAAGVRVALRVGRVDAVDLRALEDRVAAISAARRAAAVSVVKNGLPVPREDDHPALLEVADRAAADVGLADRGHRDRRHDAVWHAGLLDHALHRQRVNDGAEHAHVVGARALDPGGASVLPRMMLPPPMTRQSSTPWLWTDATSSPSCPAPGGRGRSRARP
jgi:hypothetical protein